jgi:hypothetical protein
MKIKLSRQIFVRSSDTKFRWIRPVGTELFHADRQTERRMDEQTDMTKLMVAFRNFSNSPNDKNSYR